MISVTAFVKTLRTPAINAMNYTRVIGPLRYLAQGPDFAVSVVGINEVLAAVRGGTENTLLDSDLVLFARQFGGNQEEIVDLVSGLVVFDTDDDLTCGLHCGAFTGMLGLAHYVTVSTDGLAGRLAEHTRRKPIVIPNCIDVPWFSVASQETERAFPPDTVTVGLVGTDTHWHGDWQPAVEALDKLARKYEHVLPVIACDYIPDPMRERLSRLATIEPVPYCAYPGLVRQFDIVCCALDPDNAWNQSKSPIKALESMAAARELSDGRPGGAVPVCTNTVPYQGIIDGENGILTCQDDWYDTLAELVEDQSKRNNLAANGLVWVSQSRNLVHEYTRWGQAYSGFLQQNDGG